MTAAGVEGDQGLWLGPWSSRLRPLSGRQGDGAGSHFRSEGGRQYRL